MDAAGASGLTCYVCNYLVCPVVSGVVSGRMVLGGQWACQECKRKIGNDSESNQTVKPETGDTDFKVNNNSQSNWAVDKT